jgi:hypothetical protein
MLLQRRLELRTGKNSLFTLNLLVNRHRRLRSRRGFFDLDDLAGVKIQIDRNGNIPPVVEEHSVSLAAYLVRVRPIVDGALTWLPPVRSDVNGGSPGA